MNWNKLILFAALPTFVTCLSQAKFTHKRNKFQSLMANQSGNSDLRIVGKEDAQISNFPWMCLIWASLPDTVVPLSNAIVVNKFYAVTTNHAVHAIPDPSINLVMVINFDPNHIQNQIIRQVKQIKEHVDFTDTWQYDIVLVRVCPGIPQKYHAPLAAPSDTFTTGDSATMVSYSLAINKATKMVAEWCECERYPDWTMDQHLCLECSADIYADFAAHEDFGMVPTVINGKVSAMVLTASQDCLHNYGDIALNLAKFANWIQEKAVYDEAM